MVFLGVVLCASWVKVCRAQQACCLPATTTLYEPYQIVYQRFPARGPAETAWAIVWSENVHKGLWIESAWFWRKPPFSWANGIQVLGRAGLSNVFVPYHNSDPNLQPWPFNRLYDMWGGQLLEPVPQATGDCGTITEPLLPSPIVPASPAPTSPPRRVLVKEIRDRGVAWTSDRRTRRGEEMLLWGNYDAGNYEYVIQYGFRDDGTVTFRLGSTGYNSPVNPTVAHMHNALWYIDINLGGAWHNSVGVMMHSELPVFGWWGAIDYMVPFNGGVEGFEDWNDKLFTHLNVKNTLMKNSQSNAISYDLMPMREGTARHIEGFSQHDFWVTQPKSTEYDYWVGFESGPNGPPYLNPPPLASPESIIDTDVALWYMSSNHHMPRDEDHEYAQPVRVPGVALLMWSGFDLHPRNLFDNTPLHEPPCALVPPNLVGWWPLDDTNMPGTLVTALDAAGIPVPVTPLPSLNGAPQPSPLGAGGPVPVPGVVGGALSFDGQDDYVEIPNNPMLNFGFGDFSIDGWIKTTHTTGVGVILDKRQSAPYRGYHLFLYGGDLFLQLAGTAFFWSGFNNYPANAPMANVTNVADGNWHHFAVAVTRSSAPSSVRWYIDGKDTSSNPPPIPLSGSLDNPAPLRLGVRSYALSAYWNGTLDELEIFSGALTGDEVFAIYAAGREGKCR